MNLWILFIFCKLKIFRLVGIIIQQIKKEGGINNIFKKCTYVVAYEKKYPWLFPWENIVLSDMMAWKSWCVLQNTGQ